MAAQYQLVGKNAKLTSTIIKRFAKFCVSAMLFVSLSAPLIACSENESHLKRTSKQSNSSPSYQIKNGVLTDAAGNKLAESGSADGIGAAARFQSPNGLVSDKFGNLYVADTGNNTIRKVTPAGVVTTLAGKAGESGSTDGPALTARFLSPGGITIDANGNLFVADTMNATIRKITPDGIVSTIAGKPKSPGVKDGLGAEARFDFPVGITVDSSDNLYVVAGDAVRKITSNGMVSTFAGKSHSDGYADGQGDLARFERPVGIVIDKLGNLYVVEEANFTIRKITPDGMVSTLAGKPHSYGYVDGEGSIARFEAPEGVAIDSSNNLYVADRNNHVIRKVTPNGFVSTLAGSAKSYGISDGRGSEARFILPTGMAIDGAGNLYVSDITGQTIRKITPDGFVRTLAGSHSDIKHEPK